MECGDIEQEQQQQAGTERGDDGNNIEPNNGDEEVDEELGLDGYLRTELIGQGAYGIVYKATKVSTGEMVAIKRIPFAETSEGGVPTSVIREISLLREVNHPNVVELLDVLHRQTCGLFLVFEYVA